MTILINKRKSQRNNKIVRMNQQMRKMKMLISSMMKMVNSNGMLRVAVMKIMMLQMVVMKTGKIMINNK